MARPSGPTAFWLVVFLALAGGYGLWPEMRLLLAPIEHTGPVTHVRDGDTIEVADLAIRLTGVTCDERGTALGQRATSAVRGMLQGRTVSCRLNGEKTYDRQVGKCALPNGDDLGQVLIERGLCGRCPRYDLLRSYAGISRIPFKGTMPGYCSWIW